VTKEDKTKLSLGNFVRDTDEVLLARTHLMREWALKWVLCPLLIATVLTCLVLLILDATAEIHPMRDGLLAVIGTVLGAGALGSTGGASFGWLFNRDSN
jgi:hypothetical protein